MATTDTIADTVMVDHFTKWSPQDGLLRVQDHPFDVHLEQITGLLYVIEQPVTAAGNGVVVYGEPRTTEHRLAAADISLLGRTPSAEFEVRGIIDIRDLEHTALAVDPIFIRPAITQYVNTFPGDPGDLPPSLNVTPCRCPIQFAGSTWISAWETRLVATTAGQEITVETGRHFDVAHEGVHAGQGIYRQAYIHAKAPFQVPTMAHRGSIAAPEVALQGATAQVYQAGVLKTSLTEDLTISRRGEDLLVQPWLGAPAPVDSSATSYVPATPDQMALFIVMGALIASVWWILVITRRYLGSSRDWPNRTLWLAWTFARTVRPRRARVLLEASSSGEHQSYRDLILGYLAWQSGRPREAAATVERIHNVMMLKPDPRLLANPAFHQLHRAIAWTAPVEHARGASDLQGALSRQKVARLGKRGRILRVTQHNTSPSLDKEATT